MPRKDITNRPYSFNKGFYEVPAKKQPELREEIMRFLNLKTQNGWSRRIRGLVEPTISEYLGIVNIFSAYGVPKSKIWGGIEL